MLIYYLYNLVNPISDDKFIKSFKNLQELKIIGTNIINDNNIDSLFDNNSMLLYLNDYISNDDRKLNLRSMFNTI